MNSSEPFKTIAPDQKGSHPQVSVIVPVYNRERYLGAAIESVLSQNFQDFEILIVNDGSTDKSLDIVQQYTQKHPDRIRYFEHPDQKNHGVSSSRNLGIRHAVGEYIAFLDSDDLWMPEKLQIQMSILAAYPEVACVYCPLLLIDENGMPTTTMYGTSVKRNIFGGGPTDKPFNAFELSFSRQSYFGAGSTPLIRKRVLTEVGFFDLDLTYGEDEVLMAKIALLYPVYCTSQPLAQYRMHATNTCWKITDPKKNRHQQYQIMLKLVKWVCHCSINRCEYAVPEFRIALAKLAVSAYHHHIISWWNFANLLLHIFPYSTAADKHALKTFSALLLGEKLTLHIRQALHYLWEK